MDDDIFMLMIQNPPEPKILIGAEYQIRIESGDGKTRYKSYRAVKKYSRFVLFEHALGYREAFDYWYLARNVK